MTHLLLPSAIVRCAIVKVLVCIERAGGLAAPCDVAQAVPERLTSGSGSHDSRGIKSLPPGPGVTTCLPGSRDTAVAPARATYQAVVQADREEQASSQATVSGVKQALMMVFAGQIEALADFGLSPRKVPAPRTPEELVPGGSLQSPLPAPSPGARRGPHRELQRPTGL